MDVLKQFEKHRHIPHISQLADQVDLIRAQLGQQVLTDFHNAFEGPNAKHSLSQNQLQFLAEGCLAVSILDPKIKRELLSWFVDIELSEYKALFQENQDIAWLDKIDKRFAWLKKHLVEFEDRFGRMFPPNWEVSECIAVEFCKITRKELAKVMTNRALELNVNLILPAISKSAAFEKLLSQRFTGITLKENQNDLKLATDKNTLTKTNPFAGQITQCFETHLNIYVEAQDKNLSKLIDQFVEEHQKLSKLEAITSEVFVSSGKLFTQYKNCLVQCNALSNKQPLVMLSTTFHKYLREYAHRVLQSNLPRVGALSSIVSLSTTITNAANTPGGVLSAASSAAGLLQSFLKEGEAKIFTKSELCQVCNILLTANYCLETTQQLEKKLQEKVEQTLVDKINMNAELDIFHGFVLSIIFSIIFRFLLICVYFNY